MDITVYNKERGMLNSCFEDLYISVRQKEMRVLSDSQLMVLPDIDNSDIHYKEWQIRKRSSEKLIAYLSKKNKPLKILEIGCGNGWLSSKLSEIANARVIGLDINQVEINQAKRVFKKKNLEFAGESFKPDLFKGTKFDIILFAASIQYFPSVRDILEDSFTCLAEKGEIHILDSHFYKPGETENAALRTRDYYASLGYPEMSTCYFHHTLSSLQQFNYKVLLNPGRLFKRINKKMPFYWIVINHKQK